MLEAPALPDEKIIACLRQNYGLSVARVDFLPLGADLNTAVYRAFTDTESSCFLKLRRGVFDETSAALPKILSDQGIAQIIPPLATRTGQLHARLDDFALILYPFVEGRNGYEVEFSADQWRVFGAVMQQIHTAQVPPALLEHIRRETYSPHGREVVKRFVAHPEEAPVHDRVAMELAAFLQTHRVEILDLIARAEHLTRSLQAQPPEFVVCHSDLHAGNLFIQTNGNFFIVDWDDPIQAPKERDLMFPGGAQGFIGHTAQEEELYFYQGYGPTTVDPRALTYYRCERIIQDIAVYCEQLFLSAEGGDDREQALRYLKSNFLPNGTLAAAYRLDQSS